jgi:GntR family transcriptional regulator
MIEFHLDGRSGVPTYLQLVHQVRQAVRLGILAPGDQLPTVKAVVGSLAINPNTVLKAYRELDHHGLTEGRRGQGTFISSMAPATPPDGIAPVRTALQRWLRQARAAGLDDEAIDAVVADTIRTSSSLRAA